MSILRCVVTSGFLLAFSGPVKPQSIPVSSDPVVLPSSGLRDFEIASVYPHKRGEDAVSMSFTADGFDARNMSLRDLIASAYGVRQGSIIGLPDHLARSGFDIKAKVAGESLTQYHDLGSRGRRALLQPILSDRFGIHAHVEERLNRVYEMVVVVRGRLHANEDPTIQDSTPANRQQKIKGPDAMKTDFGEIHGRGITMQALIDELSAQMDQTIINKTNIDQRFDVDLRWDPQERRTSVDSDDDAKSRQPSIFTALQEQAGLKLVAVRALVPVLVIDSVHAPSPN